jgi:excisionase family DNA binding protein
MEMDNKEAVKQAERLGDDLLNGGLEIAEFLGCPLREVYHLAKNKRLPIGRLGRKLIASRTQLRRAARALTA